MPAQTVSIPASPYHAPLGVRMHRRLMQGFASGAALRGSLGQHELGNRPGPGQFWQAFCAAICSGDMIGLRGHQQANPHNLVATAGQSAAERAQPGNCHRPHRG